MYYHIERLRKMRRWKANWAELPEEALSTIAGYLHSRADLGRLRSVCKGWHASYSEKLGPLCCFEYPQKIPPLVSPYLMLPAPSVSVVLVGLYALNPLTALRVPSSCWMVSVEELNPGFLRVLHSLTREPFNDLPENFPKLLELSNINADPIVEGRKLCFSNGDQSVINFNFPVPSEYCIRDCPIKTKILRYVDNIEEVDEEDDYDADNIEEDDEEDDYDASYIVLVLDQGGYLGTLRTNGEWKFTFSLPYDDIVTFKGNICAIDRLGGAYIIKGDPPLVAQMISQPLPAHCLSSCRKILVETDEELYMVVRGSHKLWVYKLNEELHCWKEVDSVGDRIMLLTFDDCYLVQARYFPRCNGNCIVFPRGLFAPYYSGGISPDAKLFEGVSKYSEVGVYYLGSDHCQVVTSVPGLSNLFSPPPSWLSLYSLSLGDIELLERNVTSDFKVPSRIPSCVATRAPTATKMFKSSVWQEEFQGVDVNSDLVPVLRKVFDKHGNILQGNTISSKGLLAWALESLAKMVIILQSNTGESLTESEAEFLSSTLVDLQSMHFRLDWLTPSVNQAVALHKSKGHMNVSLELEIKKTKLLDELSLLAERLVEQKQTSSPSLLKKCLGEGLC